MPATKKDGPVLLWLRQDLRLADNPSLSAAVGCGGPVIPVYVLDDESPGRWRMGGASRWWLAQSLDRLDRAFGSLGSRLIVRRGPAMQVIPALSAETGARAVHCSRMVEPWAARLEVDLKAALASAGVDLRRFGGALLHEPEAIRSQTGHPYKVYSAFERTAMAGGEPRRPMAPPKVLAAPSRWPDSLPIASLGLSPTKPDWSGGLASAWTPGEDGARARLAAFVAGPISNYHRLRDRPDIEATSQLSPHLHFGEISPHTCWVAARSLLGDGGKADAGVAKFCSELLWREFSAHLIHHWPDLPEAPFRPEFSGFAWRDDDVARRAWQQGRTGYPIVDAGMRELWTSGYMHNRVRMIAASFLIKDLLLPWQAGEAWFWDTLVDADLANNAASWQWVAGSGADAAPYFRIFNPVKQGQTFDPEGAYVRQHVPELARLPAEYIHAPFMAPARVLEAAGIVLGRDYPQPIVDHGEARLRALAAFAAIKAGRSPTR